MANRMFRASLSAFHEIYSLDNENAKGRLITLGSTLMTALYNVFITGVFYTGFLSMYGISITGVGIVTFIPFIASCFSIFSAPVLRRFKRRKPVLLAAKVYFYAMYILATTLMPLVVQDPQARLFWLCVILFLAYSVNAIFSPGLTSWFYAFYPADNERRTRFIMLNQLISSVLSSALLLLSSVLADALAGQARQGEIILFFRYLAFALVLVDVFMQSRAKEDAPPQMADVRLRAVFTLPLRHRKFLLCMLLMFYWSFVSQLNNGLWHYHLLNHLGFSYTVISAVSVAYTVIFIAFSPLWRRLLRRYSWVKTFGIANLLWVPTEVFFFLMSSSSTWIFLPNSMMQNFLNVGLNLSYANILYMNLPDEDATPYIAFQNIGCNVFCFLGMLTGTAIGNFSGDTPMPFLGLEVYSVQFTTLARGVTMLLLGIICVARWRSFTRDDDIAYVEEAARK